MKTLFFIFALFILSTFLAATIINVPGDQPTIQEGINVAVDGDTVLVQPDTYFENINYNGKNITVASLFLTTQDTTYISQTIIDGNQDGSVVTFENAEDSTAVLTGFTITNGFNYVGGGIFCLDNSSPSLMNVTITGNSARYYGGGIYCDGYSSPSLQNVIISGNHSSNWGGGIWCRNNSSPSLQNIKISGNSAYAYGGGISCEFNSNPSLMNVTITGNSAVGFGGGIFCGWNSSPSLQNVTISDNSARDGGGINCSNSSPSLQNVIISGNHASYWGGGIFCYYNSSLILQNVTISGNSADDGGGIYCYYNSNPTLVNCILWNDVPQEIYFNPDDDPNSITISYSDIQGGEAGIVTNHNSTVYWLEGNIDEAPLFVGTGDHPFMLQDLSPCVNAGIPDTTGLNLPEFDLAGNPRVYGGRIDMGAYENQNVIVNTDEVLIPLVTKLNQNYPNPFNPTTIINYSLKENAKVSLNIYNIKGQKVKTLVNEVLPAGKHTAIWNGRDSNGKLVSSGIYFYKMKAGDLQKVKKMVLIK